MKLLGNDVTLGSGLNREVDFVFDIFFMLQFATFLMAFVDEKKKQLHYQQFLFIDFTQSAGKYKRERQLRWESFSMKPAFWFRG